MDRSITFLSHSPEETFEFANKWGSALPDGSVLCFFGGLGAGKTTFIKGLIHGATGLPEDQVSSPTFVILNIYEGDRTVYHFDLYRIKNEEQFLGLGFEQYLGGVGIACIEWAENIQHLIPKDAIKISCEAISETKRRFVIEDGSDG